MAFARFRGITALLAAIMVLSVFSTALAAERSHAGKSPNDLGMRPGDGAKDSLTLPVFPPRWVNPTYGVLPVRTLPVENSDGVIETPTPSSAPPSVPRYYEASIVLTDARLSAAVPKKVAARRLSDIVQIAKSRTVMERAAEDLYREHVTSDPVVMLSSLDVEATQGGITVSIRHSEQSEARTSVEMIDQEIITRCQELDRSQKPLLNAAGSVRIRLAKDVTPLRIRILTLIFLWPRDNPPGCIGVLLGILLGTLAGRFLGRRYGSRRVYPILAALTILVFSVAGIWYNKERSRPQVYIGHATLICDPATPTSTPAEIMEIAKNRVVLDRAARVLGQLDIRTTPKHILAGMKTEQIKGSDVISIKAQAETEPEAKVTADVIARETINRYGQIHAKDASSQAVQILDRAAVGLVSVHHVADMILLFGTPIAACLITLLIAYPISHRMAWKRGTKPKPVP